MKEILKQWKYDITMRIGMKLLVIAAKRHPKWGWSIPGRLAWAMGMRPH